MKFQYALALCALLLNACVKVSTPEAQTVEHLSVNALNNSEKAPADKAEDLALAAEELIANTEFGEARKVLDLSLAADSENFRALFWSMGLDGVALYRGILIRAAPLTRFTPESIANYHKDVEKARLENSPKMFAYLMDGKEEMFNERDAQVKYLDPLTVYAERVRNFIEKNKDREFSFKARGELLKSRTRAFVDSCEVKITDALEYELICPDKRTRVEVTMNRADFEMIKYTAATMGLYMPLYNGYDLTGVIDLAVRASKGEVLENAKIREILISNSDFGRYRPSSMMPHVREHAKGYLQYFTFGMDNFADLCPKREEKPGNRPGKMHDRGICINPQWFRAFVGAVEPHTQGPVQVTSERGEIRYTTETHYLAFFDKPVKDLRDLGEMTFDRCGGLTGIGEPTLNGVFPKGDANKVLPIAVRKCEL